jgi:hypothetical protein
VNFIKYVQRNPEVSSIKSFVGIQLHPNWLNACNLRFASNVGLSYNVGYSKNVYIRICLTLTLLVLLLCFFQKLSNKNIPKIELKLI